MSFSPLAVQAMKKRMADYKNKVGSQLKIAKPVIYKDYEATDCITFVLNVLKDTFKKQGNETVSKALSGYGMAKRGADAKAMFYGDLLAKALVNKHQWIGVYLSPDRYHPTDGDQEHPHATRLALNTCHYFGVPLNYLAINYNPLPKDHKNFQALTSHKERALNMVSLKALKSIEFGFGISRGGLHTWLFSRGYVYEVHWNEVGPKLYDKTAITEFAWQSSLIVVPPDAKGNLTMAKCG